MKKKKLTINALAGSNLKTRKKQYAIMFVGIILAMVFSSSVIISIFSLNASQVEMKKQTVGIQDEILINATEKIMKEAKKDGYVDEFGYAHMIGFASTSRENETNGFNIAWLDDTAKKLSYQSFIEGSYPTKENEIAIEKSAMARLGIEAEIGDEITLEVFPQSLFSHIEHSNQKTYKLVGIAEDKAVGIGRNEYESDGVKCVPAAFVCKGTETDAGGRETLLAYLTFADFDYEEYSYDANGNKSYNDRYYEFNLNYLMDKYNVVNGINDPDKTDIVPVTVNYKHIYDYAYNSSSEINIVYMCIVSVVLALTACVAIINSFNSNIKERKQQIGMLRAVGTTRRQILRILGREALIIAVLSIPISLAISYLLVLALSTLFSEGFVLTIDILSVLLCGAVGIFTVMLAALIPIIHATRITPMQAIRNVEVARKMKIKKIKTQKSFSVPKLLAKRSMAFHKGNQIAVSVILVSAILFSCLGFSFVQFEKEHSYQPSSDYDFGGGFSVMYSFYNYDTNETRGLSDYDKQNICSAPYVSNGFGVKKCRVNILIDEYTDYFKVFADLFYDSHAEEGTKITIENYAEECKSKFDDHYLEIKSQAGYDKEFFPTVAYAVDDWKLETLKKGLVSGEINLDKLASGEEIILVAPENAGLALRDFNKYGDFTYGIAIDADIKNNPAFSLYGERDFKVGDTLSLSTLFDKSDHSEDTESKTFYDFDRNDRQVKIGAIISPKYFYDLRDYDVVDGDKIALLTSIAGMNHFNKDAVYDGVHLNVDGEITDQIDSEITNYVNSILYKYDLNVYSEYQYSKSREQDQNSMLVAMVSLIIIGFAICASLTNNAYTASIRERKRELGTLRAVGISRKEFVESYVRQLLKTFGLGYGLGFGVFTVIYLICHVIVYFNNKGVDGYFYTSEVSIAFNPWITILFCIILFGICSINLWLKIRKEMKNSIIDNIREL